MVKFEIRFTFLCTFLLIFALSSESFGIGLKTEGNLTQDGVVTKVSTSNKTFKIKDTESNSTLPLMIDNKTTFKNLSGLGSLKVGDYVIVEYKADIQLSQNSSGEIEAQLRKALAITVEKVTKEVIKQRQEYLRSKKNRIDKGSVPIEK